MAAGSEAIAKAWINVKYNMYIYPHTHTHHTHIHIHTHTTHTHGDMHACMEAGAGKGTENTICREDTD